jgi:hypothetical protein
MTVAANRSVHFGPPLAGKAAASSRRGRVCGFGGCATVLSIYNHLEWCSVHEPLSVRRDVTSRRS